MIIPVKYTTTGDILYRCRVGFLVAAFFIGVFALIATMAEDKAGVYFVVVSMICYLTQAGIQRIIYFCETSPQQKYNCTRIIDFVYTSKWYLYVLLIFISFLPLHITFSVTMLFILLLFKWAAELLD